nr:MAG TPA: hypothetical protein [Caudoviricetes sp.]
MGGPLNDGRIRRLLVKLLPRRLCLHQPETRTANPGFILPAV